MIKIAKSGGDNLNIIDNMKLLTRKLGIWMIIIGIAFQFLNIITYGYWGIDIDIIGAIIFIIGLLIAIIRWKK